MPLAGGGSSFQRPASRLNLRPALGIMAAMIFELVGEITQIETIAAGGKIRDIERLRKTYGSGRWRKLKGIALIRLEDGTESDAELHWYEAHGIGKQEMKIKTLLD
jgi:hypothetical protein